MTEKQQAVKDTIDFFYKLKGLTVDDVKAQAGVSDESIEKFLVEYSYDVDTGDVEKICNVLCGNIALFFWVVEGFEGATEHERERIFELTDYPHEKILKELGTVMRIDLLKKRDPEKFEALCKENGIK